MERFSEATPSLNAHPGTPDSVPSASCHQPRAAVSLRYHSETRHSPLRRFDPAALFSRRQVESGAHLAELGRPLLLRCAWTAAHFTHHFDAVVGGYFPLAKWE